MFNQIDTQGTQGKKIPKQTALDSRAIYMSSEQPQRD